MKKIYFSLLVFLFFNLSNSQIINFPNANFKAKLLQASSSNQIAKNLSGAYFKIDSNSDGQIEQSEAILVSSLTISVSNISNLTGIDFFPNLQKLYCSYNSLTTLNVSNLTNLIELYCDNNNLTSINVNGLLNLQRLSCNNNQLLSLNVSGLTNLQYLVFNDNDNLSNLQVTNCTGLLRLNCSSTNLTSVNFEDLPNLNYFYCNNTKFTFLDFSQNHNMFWFEGENTIYLNTLILKNGISNWSVILGDNDQQLNYICTEESMVSWMQNTLNFHNYTNCQANSYCTFNPGGTFYTIQGNNRIDSNNNGCDTNDINYTNLKLNITDGTNSGTFISNSSGNYSIPVSAGTHTFIPQLENPTYFTISPTTANVTFPATASPFTQNFCLSANGVRHDLEIVIIPVNPARPGFDATYKLKYKNKGNQVENANLVFNYNDNVLDLVSTSVATTLQNTGVLNWNLGTLNPLQHGEITVTFNLNSPNETPALNSGDNLNYTSSINGINSDETPTDNISTLNQTVVNSFDPNDKRCLEGTTISPAMIGQYVHYMVRFENTGTFPAQNIVVKDLIDLAKFDITTLQMTDASHTCYTRIDGNKVEFIFENINLDFNDATNDGYVVFKIKTKSTLTVGSQITNSANIYFDYNFPIVTNTATSTFQTLKNDNFDFGNYFTIYPNPAKDILNIKSNKNIEISSITIYTLLGQIVQTITQPTTTIDVSDLKTGNYFLKVATDKGIATTKFIKE